MHFICNYSSTTRLRNSTNAACWTLPILHPPCASDPRLQLCVRIDRHSLMARSLLIHRRPYSGLQGGPQSSNKRRELSVKIHRCSLVRIHWRSLVVYSLLRIHRRSVVVCYRLRIHRRSVVVRSLLRIRRRRYFGHRGTSAGLGKMCKLDGHNYV
jgi:hypothetical protein